MAPFYRCTRVGEPPGTGSYPLIYYQQGEQINFFIVRGSHSFPTFLDGLLNNERPVRRGHVKRVKDWRSGRQKELGLGTQIEIRYLF